MTLEERINQSKQGVPDHMGGIACIANDEPIVPLQSTNSIEVRPIWEEMIDQIEGPLYANYIKGHPSYQAVFVRNSIKQMLSVAADALPAHLRLVVRAGHRPVEVQVALLQAVAQQYKKDNPEASDEAALTHARLFVSDPKVKLPPHCTGAAVDVDVLDVSTNKLLDFGCAVNTDSEIAFLHSDKINEDQRHNRMVLLGAMLSAGFASFPSEWWHFSYGDQMWAHFYNQPTAIYGIAEPNL